MSYRPMYYLAILLLLAQAILLSQGCSKSDRDEDNETLSTSDYALAHHIFDDAFRQVHRYALGDTLLNDTNIKQLKYETCLNRKGTGLSDTVAVFPLTLSLNYADKAEPCYDAGLRYGLIRAAFSGKYLNQGSVITITFEGYRKDVYDVDGTMTVVNNGVNNNGKRYYTMIIQEGLITGRNTNITFDGSYEYVWATGSSTETEFDDDVFEIVEGEVQGRNSRGNAFTSEITQAVICDFTCAHFSSGRCELNVPNLITRYLNYGEASDCDNVIISKRYNTFINVDIPIMPLAVF